jgi:hypothetical protein
VKTMAEVLAEHPIEWKRKDGPGDRVSFIATCFKCGPLAAAKPSAHQAAALTAAGYGLVADAKREAPRRVLADREAELLNLKGACRAPGCRLHHAHRGPCDTAAVRGEG